MEEHNICFECGADWIENICAHKDTCSLKPKVAVPPEPPVPPTEEMVSQAIGWMLGITTHPDMDTVLHSTQISNVKYAARAFIQTILRNCPNSLDRMGAIRKVKEAMMLAESAITTPQVIL